MNTTLKLFLILSLYAVLTVPYLMVFPPVNNVGDESWRMNIALELLRSGRPVASMFPLTPLGEQVQITTPWLYNGLLAGFFFLFGPTIWAGRLLSLCCGAAVILIVYCFGRDLRDRDSGLLGALLLASSLVFTWHAREMRQDMMLMIPVTLSVFFLYRGWEEKKVWFLFLSGAVSTLAFQVHLHGVIFSVSILVLFLILSARKIFSRASLSMFSGLAAGTGLWLVFNYLPYSASSFGTVHKKYLPPVLTGELPAVVFNALHNIVKIFTLSELNWLVREYHNPSGALLALSVAALTAAAFFLAKNRKPLGFLVFFVLFPLFVRGFLTGKWSWFHYSVFVPFLALSLAISISIISERFSSRPARTAVIVLLAGIFIGAGVWYVMKNNMKMKEYDHGAAMERIAAAVPPGSTVLGPSLYYPAFADSGARFIGYLFLEERCPDFAASIETLGVDYILMDKTFMLVTSSWCSYRYYRDEIAGYLRTGTSLVKSIDLNYPSRNMLIKSVYLHRVIPEQTP